MSPLQRLLERFPDARRQANGWWEARCPAHEDRRASFGFVEFPDGHCTVRCQAGCSRDRILAALGWTYHDLYPARQEVPAGQRPREVAHYDYVDAAGRLLFQVVRFEPGFDGEKKTFRRRQPVREGMDLRGRQVSEDGRWVYDTRGVAQVLYRVPDVLRAVKSGELVFVVEGEKDADNLAGLGLVATTNAGGADKWMPCYTDALEGADVVVLPDNDEPGRKHADRVSWALRGRARSVRVVMLPGLPEKGDVSDWLAAGGTKEQLLALVEMAPVGRFALTDAGNAERFVGRHGHDVRYLRYGQASGEWLVWDGQRWATDLRGEVTRRAIETVRSIYVEASKEGDEERRKRLVAHALRGESCRAVTAMVTLARDLGGMSVVPDEFDTDPWLLNTPTGVVDLRTGEQRVHRREGMMRRMTRAGYDPGCGAPRWVQFLLEVFGGDEALAWYVERVLGYALTGLTTERKLWICYGSGRNGKSTLLEIVGELLGDYAVTLRSDVLILDEGRPGQPTDLSELPGARYVSTQETQEGRRLDEARVKLLTGGVDTLRARHLYKEEFSFKPQFKLFMATNAKPAIRGVDEGIWDRIRLIPFEVRFSDDPQEQAAGALPLDPMLPDKLRAEAPGILARLVRACLDWQAHGLQEPERVRVSTAGYRVEQDVLGGFLDARCVLEEGATVGARALYSAYCEWCEWAGEKAVSQQAFGRRLGKRRGIQSVRRSAGVVYVGLRLKTEEECRMYDCVGFPRGFSEAEFAYGKVSRENVQEPTSYTGSEEYEPGCEG